MRAHSLAQYNEQDLFSMTTCRWIYNEKQQLAHRYVPFNVNALIDIAVRSADATQCVSFKKISEGMTDRVFELKFDNDIEYIVKIPFPFAGPKHLGTASEVATIDFIRSEFRIPAPAVRAWASHAEETPVGTEYIMYERLPGTTLSDYDKNNFPVHEDPYIRVLNIVKLIESQMTRRGFSQVGSIYYKEDVPQHLRDRPLYSNPYDESVNSGRFRIGPIVDPEFWRSGRWSV